MIRLENLTKVYKVGVERIEALAGLDLEVAENEYLAVMGPSGSGKSTLMNIMGCLDCPTSGIYELDGQSIHKMGGGALARIRNRRIGFVFQSYNLMSRSTALSNVMMPLRYRRNNGHMDLKQKAEELLVRVGLEDRMTHKPYELSGGQQQRVAIARALVNDPAIILADEPTGNLDSTSGDEIMDLLLGLNQEKGVTLIIVTHDPKLAALTQRSVQLLDGKVQNDK